MINNIIIALLVFVFSIFLFGKRADKPVSDVSVHLISNLLVTECNKCPYKDVKYITDVILNRVSDKDFPNTVSGVIKDSGQFYGVNVARKNIQYIDTTMFKLVLRATKEKRTKAIFFNTLGCKSTWCTSIANKKVVSTTTKHVYYEKY